MTDIETSDLLSILGAEGLRLEDALAIIQNNRIDRSASSFSSSSNSSKNDKNSNKNSKSAPAAAAAASGRGSRSNKSKPVVEEMDDDDDNNNDNMDDEEDEEGDNKAISAEALSSSKLAYFEENFNVTWAPKWDISSNIAVKSLISQIEDEYDNSDRRNSSGGGGGGVSGLSSAETSKELVERCKVAAAVMVVYLKCASDEPGFKDGSDWSIINSK